MGATASGEKLYWCGAIAGPVAQARSQGAAGRSAESAFDPHGGVLCIGVPASALLRGGAPRLLSRSVSEAPASPEPFRQRAFHRAHRPGAPAGRRDLLADG